MKSIRPFYVALGIIFAFTSFSAATVNDPAEGIYQDGFKAYKNNDYATAENDFSTIIKTYPASGRVSAARFFLGVTESKLGNYDEAIKQLNYSADPSLNTRNPEARTQATFYIAICELGLAKKAISAADKNSAYEKAIASFDQLLKDNPKSPLVETILYQRIAAFMDSGNQPQAMQELKSLIAKFPASPSIGEYKNLLAELDASDASKDIQANQMDDAQTLAQAAYDLWGALDHNDTAQQYAVVVNEVQLKFYLASRDPSNTDAYQKILDLLRSIPSYSEVLAAATSYSLATRQAAIRSSGDAGTTQRADLADSHLAQLKATGDQGAMILLREAECLNALQRGDEARTILHHIPAGALPPTSMDEFDKQLVESYSSAGNAQQVIQGIKDYKAKHPADESIDGIELQAASRLRTAGLFEDAVTLVKASLTDFPNGRYATQVLTLGSNILTNDLKSPARTKELDALQPHGSSNNVQYLLSKAYSLQVQGQFDAALEIYKQIKDDPKVGAAAIMQMIVIHQKISEQKGNDPAELGQVVELSKEFLQQYPTDTNSEQARLMGDIASDNLAAKGDANAEADLTQLSSSSTNEAIRATAGFALIKSCQKRGDLDGMEKAASAFRASFPNKIPLLAEITRMEADSDLDQKQYDKAVAAYQTELNSTDKEVAARAQYQIGDVYAAQARDLKESKPDDARKALSQAESAYLALLDAYPDNAREVGSAIDGLKVLAGIRVSWGDYKDQSEVEKAFEDWIGKVTTPEAKFHLSLAKIACVLTANDGRPNVAGFAKALTDFKALMATSSSTPLTRQETLEYVRLLSSQKQDQQALQLLDQMAPSVDASDPYAAADLAVAYITVYLHQGRWADAKAQLDKMHDLPGDATTWYPESLEVKYDTALIAENTADTATAKSVYANMMKDTGIRYDLIASALIGYGRILEKEGKTVSSGDMSHQNLYAAYFYRRVNLLYGTGVPEKSAEGLVKAMDLYIAAQDKTNAQKMFDSLKDYQTTAPEIYQTGLDHATINGLKVQ